MSYVCIGAPYWIGERQTISAVEAIKQSGIAEVLSTEWVDIQPDYETYPEQVVAVNVALAEAIKAHADKTPLIFAGDCTFALGAMKGLEDQHPAILWYDAHGDFNTPATSPSGIPRPGCSSPVLAAPARCGSCTRRWRTSSRRNWPSGQGI